MVFAGLEFGDGVAEHAILGENPGDGLLELADFLRSEGAGVEDELPQLDFQTWTIVDDLLDD